MSRYSDEQKFNYSHKFINDPIYGGIGLSKVETDLINTPVFQRLRHLKQLGFASYVFPGGEHSRFVHSLGVLHIMGLMCRHLQTKYPEFFTQQDTFKMRIAALLHDIGHYPLSHLGESVYCYESTKAEQSGGAGDIFIGGDPAPDPSPNLLVDINNSSITRKHAHHEKLGLIVVTKNDSIKTVLEKAEIDTQEIGNIFSRANGNMQNTLYYNLLHSSLDADRLDYLIRDSVQTGVKFGQVDLDYLIRLLTIKLEQSNINGKNIKIKMIAFNKKGQHVIEHFLMSRYFHYAQVINHRTSGAFEAMAKVVFYKLIEQKQFVVNTWETLFKPDDRGNWFVNSPEFLRFTDHEWWHSAATFKAKSNDELYNMCYDLLLNRVPPRTVYFTKDILNYKEIDRGNAYFLAKRAIRKNFKKFADEAGFDINRIGYCVHNSSIEKDAHKFSDDKIDISNEDMMDCIKILDDNQRCTLLAKDQTSIINKVADLYAESLNVFYISNKDEESFDIKKTDFNKLIAEY